MADIVNYDEEKHGEGPSNCIGNVSLEKPGATDHKDLDSTTEHSERSTSAAHDPDTASTGIVPIEPPPDGGYGWVIVLSSLLVNAHTWGVNSSYGVFLAHYLDFNTFPGATPLEYAFVGGLSLAACQSISPVATISTRVFGTRITMFIGVIFETVALLGASWSTRIWHLFLSQGICFGWGMGFLFIASVPIIPQWFDKKRSFAMSVAAAGSGIGGLIYALGAQAMIQSVGLPWTFRILAIAAAVVNIICILLIRDRNKIIGTVSVAFDTKLLKRPEVMLLIGWAVFTIMGYVVLLFSMPNYARSVGLNPSQASVIGALLNLGQAIGRPFIGYYSDSFGRINIALLGTFLSGLFSLVIWIFAKSYGVLIFFSLLAGAFAGTFWTTIAPVSAEVVGLKILPSALNLIWLSLVIPSIFAEPIALELKKKTGDIYLHSQIFTGLMYIAAAVCAWFLRAWKIRDLEKTTKEETEFEQRTNGSTNDEEVTEQPPLSRTVSLVASVKSSAKGLFKLQRV